MSGTTWRKAPTWRALIRAQIAQVLQQLPRGTSDFLKRKALKPHAPDAGYYPRKVWRQEVRRALGVRPQGTDKREASGPQLLLFSPSK